MRSSSGSSFWTWLLGAGAAGGLAYLIFDKLTETSSRNPGTSPLGTKTVGGPATGALAGGVLYKACKNDLNAIESTTQWVDVDVPSMDLIVTISQDALRCDVGGESLRMPVTYKEQVEICNMLDCISPVPQMVDDIWKSAQHIQTYGLNVQPGGDYDEHLDLVKAFVEKAGVNKWPDQKLVLLMQSLVMSKQLNANITREVEVRGFDLTNQVIRSLGKNWVIDPIMVNNGAANYGWYKLNGEKHQGVYAGGQHNAEHYDYSQLFCDCPKVVAKKLSDPKTTVDLRDVYRAKFPSLGSYIDAYEI